MYNQDILGQPFVLAKSTCYFYHCIHIHNMYLPTYEPPYRWSLRGFPSKHNSAEYANKYHYNPSVISTTAYTYICIYPRMNLSIGGLLGGSPLNTAVLSMPMNTTLTTQQPLLSDICSLLPKECGNICRQRAHGTHIPTNMLRLNLKSRLTKSSF